ncbi:MULTISPECIES: hypothetical protein [Halomonadaceae]|uniref:hypothetical protein n=1 Tax=Halomonadaceae TaxID=28256 RepID=UPI001583A84E|nr:MULTISPECIES: hypothetical protein [Halomonas]MDI4637433.1 hypothetical protein [Halomonas sp. BMC7]NUJ61267.1 hypothetical protein [Halomonas taeanensis]
MTSMKSRQMGVVWLFVMYLAMMWLFLWDFSLAFTVFSITWCLCFFLQRYLPEMPYPTLDKTTLNPPRFASVPFFIFFSAPAIIVAGVYQVGLFFDHDYMELYWPIERLLPENGADFFHYRDWRDAQRKSGYGYDSIYLLIDYLDVCFFAFLFFLAHWFLGSVGFISQVDERYGPLGKRFLVFLLRGFFASFVMFFIVFFCALFGGWDEF